MRKWFIVFMLWASQLHAATIYINCDCASNGDGSAVGCVADGGNSRNTIAAGVADATGSADTWHVYGACTETLNIPDASAGNVDTWNFYGGSITTTGTDVAISFAADTHVTLIGPVTLTPDDAVALKITGASDVLNISNIVMDPTSNRCISYSGTGTNYISRINCLGSDSLTAISTSHASGTLTLSYIDVSDSASSGMGINGNGNVTIYNMTSHDNAVSGILLPTTGTGDYTVLSSIFANNTGADIDDGDNVEAGTITFNKVNYFGGGASDVSDIDDATDLDNVDPGLRSDGHSLNPDSVCIDTGGAVTDFTPNYVDESTTDVAGTVLSLDVTNTTDAQPYTGTAVDRGAYEQRFYQPSQQTSTINLDLRTHNPKLDCTDPGVYCAEGNLSSSSMGTIK